MTFIVQFYIEGHTIELSNSPSLSLPPYFLLGSLGLISSFLPSPFSMEKKKSCLC